MINGGGGEPELVSIRGSLKMKYQIKMSKRSLLVKILSKNRSTQSGKGSVKKLISPLTGGPRSQMLLQVEVNLRKVIRRIISLRMPLILILVISTPL